MPSVMFITYFVFLSPHVPRVSSWRDDQTWKEQTMLRSSLTLVMAGVITLSTLGSAAFADSRHGGHGFGGPGFGGFGGPGFPGGSGFPPGFGPHGPGFPG